MTKTIPEELTDEQLETKIRSTQSEIAGARSVIDRLQRELRTLESEKRGRVRRGLETGSTPYQEFQSKWRELDDLMGKHEKFGASDTEPRYHRFRACEKALLEGRVEVPTSARGWEMFSDMPGSGKAAQEITKVARQLCRILTKLPRKEAVAAAQWIGVDL